MAKNKTRFALNRTKVFRIVHAGGTPLAVVTCDRCGKEASKSCSVNTSPSAVAQWFKRENWLIKGDGNRAKCPDCSGKAGSASSEPGLSLVPPSPPTPPPAAPPPRPPPKAAPRICQNTGCENVIAANKDARVRYCSVKCRTAFNHAKDRARKKLERSGGTEAGTPVARQGAAALRSQRHLYRLLEENFDPDDGVFADGWDDQRLAKETSLSIEHVVKTREAACLMVG